jgi:hypothetical protein
VDRLFVVVSIPIDPEDKWYDTWFRLAYAEGRILFVSNRHANLIRVQAFLEQHPEVSLAEAVRESLVSQPSI